MLFILNKNYEVVESLNDRGNMAVITPYFDDEYLQDLNTGAETFTFSTLADSIQSQHLVVGNFIAFRYKNEYKLFNIINVDEEHTDLFIKNVYCEMASIELINEIIRPMSFSGTVKSFVDTILEETSWQLGRLDMGFNQTFDIELTDYKTVYTLLQEYMVNTFGAEISYRVEIKNNKIVGKYVDVYAQRGSNKGLRFAYSKNLTSVKRTIDTSNIATALIGIGNNNITFKDVDAEDKPAGQDFITDDYAYRLWNVNGHHIMGTFKADTDSPQELLKLTREELAKRSTPNTKYEMKVELLGEDVSIGDTVKIVDHSFNPPIQLEGRVNQLIISQTDPTKNECVLANFKEIGSNITKELKELAGYVESKFPIGSDDIQEGAVGEKQISKQYHTQVVADAVYASLVETEELIATKADIEDLNATNATIENLKAKDVEIENAIIDNAEIFNAEIENLKAKNAIIENAIIEKADIEDLNAINATIENLKVKDAQIENAVIENANITNANINNLKANVAEVEILVAEKANIEDLNATNAEIIKLKAMDAEINNAIIENAEITFAEINQLKADVGEIDTLLAGNITSENIQAGSITSNEIATGTITAGSGIIADGAIGSAQISSLDASKISAGKIDTSKVEVAGVDNHLRIKGNRLQVFQGIGNQAKERVSLGDVNGDGSIYGLRVRGADGQTILLDENGVTSEGITDGSITNNKISDDANIDGAKLNINSVVSKINEDGTETIQGTKIEVDGTTLNTKLSTITNKQTEDSERITQAQTQISANTNAIKLKVDSQTYQTDKTNMTTQMNKNTSEISAMKGEIALKVEQADIENAVSEIEGVIDTKVESAKSEIKITTDAISQNVSNLSQTVSNKADGSTVTTLSNKVGSLETSVNGISGKVSNLETTTTSIGKKADNATTLAETANATAQDNKTNIGTLSGEVTTVKSNIATLDVNLNNITQRVSNTESTTSSLSTQLSGVSSTATNALNKANSANTLADSKAKVFTTTPTTPYKIGDLWVQGTSGDVMRCKTARSSGSYTASDWEKASKYTDDTKANAVDGKVTNLQTEYNKTKSQVAEIVTDLDGITQRVSNTESTTATITADLQSVSNIANSANTNASSALDKATTATNTANSALSQANTNKGNITSLQGTVNTTNSKVATLETNLNGITQRVSSTESTTATLTTKVNNVESTANNAKTTADSAKTTATNAQSTANTANSNATSAINKANNALQKKMGINLIVNQGTFAPNQPNKEGELYIHGFDANGNKADVDGYIINPNNGTKITIAKCMINANDKIPYNQEIYLCYSNRLWFAWYNSSDKKWKYLDANADSYQGTINNLTWGDSHLVLGVVVASGAEMYTSGFLYDTPKNYRDAVGQTLEFTSTKSQVSTIETNLSGITSRVGTVESKTSTLEGKVTSHETRISTAEQKITDKAIINTVSSTIDSKINNVKIGGRNLLLGTSNEFKSYSTGQYYTTVGKQMTFEDLDLKNGDEVVFKVYLKPTENKGARARISYYYGDGTNYRTVLGNIINVGSEGYSEVKTTLSDINSKIWCGVNSDDTSNTTSAIGEYKEPKFEKGNKSSAWTPAPEDVENIITETEKKINGNIDNAVSSAKDDVLKNIGENYTSKDEFNSFSGTVTSKLEQTSKDITATFTTAQEYTKEVDGKLQSFKDTVGTHIRFSSNGIDLGKTDSPFTATLDNTQLAFKQNNETVAYISNNKMHITQAEIKDSLRIGTNSTGYFTWVQSSSGNLSLKWSDK